MLQPLSPVHHVLQLQELERTNAVLTSKKHSLEKEAQRTREASARDARNAEAKAAELELQVATLRQKLDDAALSLRESELRHAEEAKAGEQGEAAQRKVAELERQANKQRASHKQRLEELRRYYDRELAKTRAEGEAAGRADAETVARERLAARERELKDAAAAEVVQGTKQLKDEVKALRADLARVEREAGARVAVAEQEADDARAGRDAALQRVAELRACESGLRSEVERLREEGGALQGQLAALALAKDEMVARQESQTAPLVAAMETSLKNLSSRLRCKEEETAALKSTVQRECQERMALLAELTLYRSSRGGDTRAAAAGGPSTGAGGGLMVAWGGEEGHAWGAQGGEAPHSRRDGDDEGLQDRAPSCPPTLGHKGERGWGLLPNISRGPSPAQLHEARVTKEQVSRGGRVRRIRPS